ncbi:Ribulokinase-like protein [Scheffersomyces stipitis CBS 6054]|uniref:Ribulokinase-like protein n=1 Tax=Scheffersomyces stipitis (strain ATCC 58785 / CBS 6054 / NBRC 10063 / NRRL Y-11545) TaxID=322104 RepID=A3LP09_PICST|nr:Ribulokinase-like protein [Scheffersomyces stipitis CBS 6054]ABN64968.2 Ribulokinase-like protein [Scheffersomyces stipitis CBS 6054]
MTAVGIDVGTGSVRVYCENKDTIQTYEAEIATTHNANFITQSSKEIFTKILDLFARLNIDHVSGISTTATCSMVVLQKMEVNGSTFLKPFSQISGISDTNGPIPNQDVFLWMDGRAFKQTDRYNQRLRDTKFSSSVGGKFVPELGVPKLKWLSDNFPESNLVCFELYDWINYLLLVGGFSEKELVEYRPRKKDFNNDSSAMDGSIKGWSKQTLTSVFEISKNIEIGGADFDVATEFLLPVGYPLGTVHKAFAFKDAVVGNGCIDCYAGWLSTIVAPENRLGLTGGQLSMIAGTSTCFLLASECTSPITGVWGPYDKLLPNVQMYELGQPATGKLFEKLFSKFDKLIQDKLGDKATIRNYFYYGDVFGNRSPLSDFTMSEMVIDGYNYDCKLAPIIDSHDKVASLVIRYNLILEFLCFQTKHIIEVLSQPEQINITEIVVSGSQANNRRFLQLLSDITNLKVTKLCEKSKYSVAKGASIMAEAGTGLMQEKNAANIDADSYARKYEIYKDMAKVQAKYRELVNSD